MLKTQVEVHALSSYRRQVFSLPKCLKLVHIVFLLDHEICFPLLLEHVVTVFFYILMKLLLTIRFYYIISSVAWYFVTMLIFFNSSALIINAIPRELLFDFRLIMHYCAFWIWNILSPLKLLFSPPHLFYQFHWSTLGFYRHLFAFIVFLHHLLLKRCLNISLGSMCISDRGNFT